MNFDKYSYIVVEGPIGVGKTTLAQRFASEFGARLVLERPEENPFLEKFYRDANHHALPTQLSFLFQRVNQLQLLRQSLPARPEPEPGMSSETLAAESAGLNVIADFLLDKDALFAKLTLGDDELALYRQVYERLDTGVPQPDLVIYLQAQPETLIERIRKRGISMENGISEEYMIRLCESYSRFFHDYDAAPLLIVNAEHLNPADSDEDFNLLLAHIRSMRGRREFFSRGE
ncbi:MAG: deoxynucleoside kinase [Janthinobacterium lividum]